MSFVLPKIGIAPLFGARCEERELADKQLMNATSDTGVMLINNLPRSVLVDAAVRRSLIKLFRLPKSSLRRLSRNWDDPKRPFQYRGWFDVRQGRVSCFEGIQVSRDTAYGDDAVNPSDPLMGPSMVPQEHELPGWRAAATEYFLGMEHVANGILRSIARGLSVPEAVLSDPFSMGMSTLQILRYPVRSQLELLGANENPFVVHEGTEREITSEAHTDFGFITLLNQDGVEGLQVKTREGQWIEVRPLEDHLVVNFGRLLERWTCGAVRATEHRVLSCGKERFSLPFFYEPRTDAEIGPLPTADAEGFEPFLYGEHVWHSIPRLQRLFGSRVCAAR